MSRSEVAPLVSGVPGAIHESFNTVGEASRSFAQARDNGVTKAVGRDPESRLGASQMLSTHESVQACPSRSSTRASETPKARQFLTGKPSNMAKAQSVLLPAVYHPNTTYIRRQSLSSSRASPMAKQQATPRNPRVIVRTPSDVPSYPSDSEEPFSPSTLSRSFNNNLSLERQAPQEETSSFTSIQLETSRPMDNLPPLPDAAVSQPTSHFMEPLDITLGSLDSPKFFTPKNMSPLTSGSPMHGGHSNASFSPTESSSCPKCGFICERKPPCVPEVNAPESLLDPRSPLTNSGFRFGSQLRIEDDLSLSELSLADRVPVSQKMFSLLAPTQGSSLTRPNGSADGDRPEGNVTEETKEDKRDEHDKRLTAKLHEDKLQSDIFILKKLNASFALFNEALQDTGSANQRVAMQLEQTDALLNKYISILSKSEEFTHFIFDQQWQGADADEEALEYERIAQIEKARRDAEEKALAKQQEEERLKREAQEQIEKEERERVEQEKKKEKAVVRGGIRGRGTRASMRGTSQATTRAGNTVFELSTRVWLKTYTPGGSTLIRGRSMGTTTSREATSKLPMPSGTATRTSSSSNVRGLSRR
ncbi:hypothetical protein C0992_009379 [Termitomyces sp. T32_za158]|nr:hypothetical protein C0992_009379 [Termitomyces sp. T32_za158]